MFSRILFCALSAGAAAGLCSAVLHWFFIQPILRHAELYEQGTLVHFPVAQSALALQNTFYFDLVRDSLSAIFAIIIAIGYSLMVISFLAWRHHQKRYTTLEGCMIGVIGFCAFQLAPTFGLSPEVPGNAAAKVSVRQLWWFSTIACTFGAIALFRFSCAKPKVQKQLLMALATLILFAPHIIEAPHPDYFTGVAPPEISALFASRVLGVGFIVWILIGGLCVHYWNQETPKE